tara:strand:+ start:7284 stop:7889 length:606 start_codon:yes stop_codon:yes gene_type:complete
MSASYSYKVQENLASTQSVISLLQKAISQNDRHILNIESLFDVAEIVGKTIRQVIQRDQGQNQGIDFGCNIILSGQIRGEESRLFHIYPQGNFIEASDDTPYFQIGESKYGKPILDRIITIDTPIEKAIQCVLISMDSTLRSNLSVGMPLDLMRYEENALCSSEIVRLDEFHPNFLKLRNVWSEGIKDLFNSLPLYMKSES